jgi:hypothetical protein
MISANRGEWSELYALGYLLVNGGGYGADELAKIDTSIFYKVLQVVDNPSGSKETVYTVEDSQILISQSGLGVVRIAKEEILPSLREFLADLVSKTDARAFSLASGDSLLALLMKSKLSASATLAADLHLVLEDIETKIATPKRSFSIKSEIGGAATVFNASGSTNLTYKVIGPRKAAPFEDISPVKSNLKKFLADGFTLQLHSYDNPKLQKSLENIDSNLPQYLGELMLAYYFDKTKSIKRLCESIWPSDQSDSDLKVSKIKKFLSAISMGLRANQVWSGYPQDFGGLLLVKENGDVLFYYLYNLQKFEEYLYSHLRFETPSATRHGFGQIYEVDGNQFMKLNLQIRF